MHFELPLLHFRLSLQAESKMAENLAEENVFNENIKFSFGEVKGGALDEDEDDDEVLSLYSTCFPVCW